ncbi:hypothetical protein N2152v2_002942 [Parachlorella kessleri]
MTLQLARLAFLASLTISIAGTIIALGGLASIQSFCDEHNGIFAGIRTEYLAQAKLLYGNTSCGRLFRFEWWGWALQVTFLVITAICYATTNVHNYKSALWSLAATAVVLAMFQANDLVDLYEKTKDTLRTRGVVTFIGYCGFCAGDYLMFFTGNALYHYKRAEHQQQQQKLQGVTMA